MQLTCSMRPVTQLRQLDTQRSSAVLTPVSCMLLLRLLCRAGALSTGLFRCCLWHRAADTAGCLSVAQMGMSSSPFVLIMQC